MEKYQEKLDIVDEDDNIIGQDTRENVHKKGLLHREIQVFIYNNKGEILFQKRSLKAETRAGLFAVGIGGHLDLGESYDMAAIRELREETSVQTNLDYLSFVKKIRIRTYDEAKNTINNKFVVLYSYKLKDSDILKLEEGKAVSFEFWNLDRILNLSVEEKKKITLTAISKEYLEIYKELLNK